MLVSWPSFSLDLKFVYAQDEMLSLMLAMEERVTENTRRSITANYFILATGLSSKSLYPLRLSLKRALKLREKLNGDLASSC